MAEQARSVMKNQGQQAMWEFIRENTEPEPERHDVKMGIATLSDGSAVTFDIDRLAFLKPFPDGEDHEAHQEETLVDQRPHRLPVGSHGP